MSQEWSYAIVLLREDDEVHAFSEDLPEAIASGISEDEAAREMIDALVAAVRGRIKDEMDLTPPRTRDHGGRAVALPEWHAVKASVYGAIRTSGTMEAALYERTGRSEAEIRGILDPDTDAGLDLMAEAARALGGPAVDHLRVRTRVTPCSPSPFPPTP